MFEEHNTAIQVTLSQFINNTQQVIKNNCV